MKNIFQIAKYNCILWFHSPVAVLSALIPPISMVVLLAVLSFSVTKQPVALVMQASGKDAVRMENIIKADTEAYSLHVTSLSLAKQFLENQEVAAVIVIPASFSESVENQQNGTILLTLNNIDSDFSDDIRRSLDRSIAEFNAPQLGNLGQINGSPSSISNLPNLPNPYLINIDEYNTRKTTIDFLHYQLIPAFILLILSVGMTGTAFICMRDKQIQMTPILFMTPLSSCEFCIGRLFGGFALTAIVVFPLFFIASLMHLISFPAVPHLLPLLLLMIVTILCANGLGAFLGTFLRGSYIASLVCMLLATYLFFLGGGFTTIAFLPQWIQVISGFNPMRYAIDGLRQILFYPDLTGVFFDMGILVLTTFLTMISAVLTLRKSFHA